MKKKISIVIPTRNMEKYIEKCIDSVLVSETLIKEIIVVDFGSQDKTLEILDRYCNDWNFIHVYEDYNGNAASARNKGIQYATGEYLAFIDADDWYEAEFLEELCMYMEQQQLDIVSCGYKQVYENSSDTILKQWKNRRYTIDLDNINDEIRKLLTGNINLEVWNKLYRLSFIKKNNIYFDDTNGINGEDIYFNVIAFMHQPKILVIEKCLYCHLIRNNSLSNTKKIQLTERFITLIELLYDYSLSQKYILEEEISILMTNLIIQDLGINKNYSSIENKVNMYRNNRIVMKLLNSGLYSKQTNIKQKCFNFFIIHNVMLLIKVYVKKCL